MEIATYKKLANLAESAAYEAGQRVIEMQSDERRITSKGFRDMVTDADYLAQSIITSTIRRDYPEHGFLTEEADDSLPQSGPYIWVIDPVDGTTNYSRNQPNYSISIAAATVKSPSATTNDVQESSQIRPVAGVIYDPSHSEMFSAAAGSGAFLNNHPVQVSSVSSLSNAVVGLDWGRSYGQRERMLEMLGRLAHEVHTLRAVGSAAQSLAWVACGRMDVYINFSVGAWDSAAASVIIDEAGGSISNLLGRPWQITDAACVASNGKLQSSVLEIILNESRL